MRGVCFVLLLALTACATPPAPESPFLDDDLHGFEPDDDLVQAALLLGGPERATAIAEVEMAPPARRIAVLRAGLRLRDTYAARTCASLLEWKHLDDWEQGRMSRLLADAAVDEEFRAATGYEGDFSALFECASGAEMPYVLDLAAAHAGEFDGDRTLSYLHKSCSAEHLPQLARVASSSNAEVRKAALDIILTVTIHTDQHREDVAAAILGISVDEAHSRYPDDGAALSPLLVAVLSLDAFPFDPNSQLRMWARRWLKDSHPAARDVEFLLRLDAEDEDDRIAWILRDVYDPRVTPWLVATVQPPQPERIEGELLRPQPGPSPIRLGALALRGDGDALARLVAGAEDHSEFLGVLLAVAPADGRALVDRIVFGDDFAVAREMLDHVRRAWEDVPTWPGIEWDEAAFDGFAEAAVARKLDGVLLATIGVCVPRCRTRELAAAAVAAMPREKLPLDEDESHLSLDGDVASFLETAAPEAFRLLLRDWSRSSDETTRTAAIGALARLGDPPSGALLVGAARRGEVELPILARSPCDEVLAFLREHARGDFAAAVAYGNATGLPERVGLRRFCTDEDDPLAPESLEKVRSLLLEGRWRDAVFVALTAEPERIPVDQGMDAVGLVDDDRVRACLQRLRGRRELRLYPWATAELANMGDAAARSEYEHALRTGRYRWRDESDQIAFGDGLRALPFWIDLLETNCCAFTTIRANVFRDWFDFEFDTEGGGGASTPVAEARRFVARANGRFVWSRLADSYVGGRYVPAPR